MLYAMHESNRVTASPGAVGACPVCMEPLTPKCGEIVAWHWAHRLNDCDPWYEPEGAWHLRWKEQFAEECREVVVGGHRADVRTPGGCVIELQHSSISPEEIREREQFYGNMLWVIDAEPFANNLSLRERDGFTSFRWRWPRKSLMAIRRPLFFDLHGKGLLEVRKLHGEVPCGGWGKFVPLTRVIGVR